MCAISFGERGLALRLANKRTTSLPEDSDTEYSWLHRNMNIAMKNGNQYVTFVIITTVEKCPYSPEIYIGTVTSGCV